MFLKCLFHGTLKKLLLTLKKDNFWNVYIFYSKYHNFEMFICNTLKTNL